VGRFENGTAISGIHRSYPFDIRWTDRSADIAAWLSICATGLLSAWLGMGQAYVIIGSEGSSIHRADFVINYESDSVYFRT
jgi:hypothetical protein